MQTVKESPKAKTYHAVTEDGWKIALHRYERHSRHCPVLLIHGLASNRHNMDFPNGETSLARYLWKKGWDTWVIELRGAGHSSPPSGLGWLKKSWTVDHYVRQDLPAAVRFILEKTKHTRLHWVGHSLGGLLISPFVNTHSGDGIQSVVVAASPMTGIPEKFFKWTYLMEPLLRIFPVIPYRILARVLGFRPHWLNKGPIPPLYVRGNMEAKTLRIGARIAVDDLPSGVIRQFQQWMRSRRFRSADGKIRYHVDFKKLKFPFLILTAALDPLTPYRETKKIYDNILSRKKSWVVFGKDHGHTADYSHWDLILGRHAPREVYPTISRWLRQNDG